MEATYAKYEDEKAIGQSVITEKEIADEARIATSKEHGLTVRQGLKAYRKAIGWSILLSSAVIMEGYDTILVSQPMTFLADSRLVLILVSHPSTTPLETKSSKVCLRSPRHGKLQIFISFFGKSLPVQLVGQILCGIPWGVYQTVTTVYASEVLPVNLRGYLTSYVNLCWVIGQFIASGVLVGVESRTDQWGWRIPFAVQWVWPIPIIFVCLFCPESPTWLVEHGRDTEAEKAVSRLQSSSSAHNIPTPHETVALLSQTNTIEKRLTAGAGYLECFKGTNLRRTEIAVGTWVVQQMCGPVLQTYAIYFFEQAGLPSSQAFNMSLGLIWSKNDLLGRSSVSWAVGAFLLIFTFIYDSTVGPLTYVIVPEAPSSRLRHKTIVIARNMYNITCIWTGVITPYMLNSTAWNWGAKAGFFWAGCTAVCLVWAYFRIPETKGFTFAELDLLFEEGVPARKFATTRGALLQAEGTAERMH
ncbi:hypothetical protein IAR55_005577 [Kwoniella newhampshirensis]|uniref:Major facilitator superfamily (MFS) profile domain-containing protein n=1 Tax=Kwoniella newhampshirensis TaxID=1651941 RepID=A0AAW0YVV7_9TREE